MADTKTEKQKVKEITDKLEEGLKELFESEKYKSYLSTMSKFHNYSFNNTLLIALQKPEASLVAGFKAWQTNFNRHVKKGEKGIRILAPAPYKVKEERDRLDPVTGEVMLDENGMPQKEEVEVKIPAFRAVSVFDISQTDGEPIPELEAKELLATVEGYEDFIKAITYVAPAPVSFEDIPGDSKGYFSPAENRVAVQEGMSESQTLKTLIHETAHSILHRKKVDSGDIAAPAKDRNTKEVEAESVAYTVCQHFGIDTSEYSFGYIAGWSSGKDMKELKSSLDTIRRTASELITGIEGQLQELQRDRELMQAQEKESVLLIENGDLSEYSLLNVRGMDAAELVEALSSMNDDDRLSIAAYLESRGAWTVEIANEKTEDAGEYRPDVRYNTDTNEITEAAEEREQPELEEKAAENVSAEYDGLPDPEISISDMRDYGYTWEEMLPLTKETAWELFGRDLPIYQLHMDGSETLVEGEEQITEYEGIFGIEKSDWENERNLWAMQAELAESQPAKEAQLLYGSSDRYGIYQLKDEPGLRDYHFAGTAELLKRGILSDDYREIQPGNYNLVYVGELSEIRGGTQNEKLEALFEKFNIDHPEDFKGHSLSVSDLVVLHEDGENSAHFVDSYGFTDIPDFIRALEGVKEQEYPTVYRESLTYAMEHGEVDKYHDSRRLDRECKRAIEETIRQNFDGMHLNQDIVKPLAEQYGSERIAFVLANTLQQESWDGRFSKENKAWAAEFSIPENIVRGTDMNSELIVNSHPAVLDGFIDMFRSEVLEQEKELSAGQEKTTSGHDVQKSEAEQPETQAGQDEPEKSEETPEFEDMEDGDEIIDLGDERDQVLAEMKQSLEGGQDTAGHDANFSEIQNGLEQEQAAQEETVERELAFQIADRFISIQETDGGYDYSIMDMDYKVLEGGVYDDPDVSIREALKDIVDDLKTAPRFNGAAGNIGEDDEMFPIDYDRLMEMVEAAQRTGTLESYLPQAEAYLDELRGEREREAAQQAHTDAERQEPEVTLTVAECGEFHSLGEFYENIPTVEEAVAIWKQIPPERRNGIPAIGINVHEPGAEPFGDMEADLVSGKRIDLEILDHIPDMKNNPKVMEFAAQLVAELEDMEIDGVMTEKMEARVWELRLPKLDEAGRLAVEIDRFSYAYDADHYHDSNRNMTENVLEIKDALEKREAYDIAAWLTDVAAQGTEPEEIQKAVELLEKLTEYRPLAKIEEAEEQNYNMIDNVLNNGAGEEAQKEAAKREQEQPAARVSLKARLAEKKALVAGKRDAQEKENSREARREIGS